nr:PREDICTED: UMP-CMP kinase 2, mitochondrial [Latimeria chalumnae]|eukprot:XP_014345662.1 PREDICTED: UMP-CMP kinase 2, mitochondrial [Latimeria chalumnae]
MSGAASGWFTMARPFSSAAQTWLTRVFGVEVSGQGDPIYFALSASPAPEGGGSRALQSLFQSERAYSLCISAQDRILKARLHAEYTAKFGSELSNCRVLALVSFCPGATDSLQKGFLIQDSGDAAASARTQLFLRALQGASEHVRFCTYERDEAGRVWQSLWAPEGQSEQVCKACIVPAPEPHIHPSVLNIKNSVVFYRYEDAYSVLQESSFFFFFLNSGKTTLTESLKDSLKATLLKSPPGCISQWRKIFDDEPAIIRRAFYALGNYISASDIAKESIKSFVIVDRYWHSTAAYAIATEVGSGVSSLPPCHHEVYQWPEDLLKPDLVLLLTVSPEERVRRLLGRGVEKTKEETELEANNMFRQKVEEVYRRMENPRCVIVDASPAKEEVLREVLLLIRKHCSNL